MISQASVNVSEFNLKDAMLVIDGKFLKLQKWPYLSNWSISNPFKGKLMKGGVEFPPEAAKFSKLSGDENQKFDSLHEYFKTMTHAINQHAIILNKLTVKSQDFVEHNELRSVLDKIEGVISIYDDEFLNKLEIDG